MTILSTSRSLVVALGEYDTRWHDPEASLSSARQIAHRARSAGADLLVLPEMCATGFTMEADEFAEPVDGASVQAFCRLAAEEKLWIIAGLSMRKDGQFVNSALAFSPDGSIAASYDKQRLFGFASETSVYSAGDKACIVSFGGMSLALFVCFDLRFPELFREVAPDVDGVVVIAKWPAARQQHWEILTRARAIENQCYLIGVNRIGEGGGLSYEGGSVVLDPWGERIDAPAGNSGVSMAQVSHRAVVEVRNKFPLGLSRAHRPD
jgi:predicted amidohydrolase